MILFKKPKPGTEIDRERFAWIPTKVLVYGQYQWVWLEWYREIKHYDRTFVSQEYSWDIRRFSLRCKK